MTHEPVLTLAELVSFLDQEFPELHEGGRAFHVDAVEPGAAIMRLEADRRHLRPGATVSGPSLMTLADVAAYAAILAHVGPVAMAVTTSFSINFLRKSEPGPVICRATLMKLGKRLAVVDCNIQSGDALIAHAVATYSIPPR
ncbi:PaaI family thioesterase [Segnochrobactraceae bacterium EtOH-i3]